MITKRELNKRIKELERKDKNTGKALEKASELMEAMNWAIDNLQDRVKKMEEGEIND
jgi:predicted  nucleic acid-binding Zn-ribbon protein